MLIPEEIYQGNISKELKIVRLWAIAQLNYRQPYGDLAIKYLHKILDRDTTGAIFFITGFSSAGLKPERLKGLIPLYLDTEAREYNLKTK